MKKIQLLILSVLFSSVALAQQQAMFTEYMYNEVTLNPAYAGSHGVISATAIARRQWVGIEGAPSTLSFNAHSPLKNENIALGISIVHDQITVSRNFNMFGSASYKIAFSKENHLHFGLQYGFTSISEDLTSFDGLQSDASSDPDLGIETASGVIPNVGFGMYYYNHQFYIGVSSPQLLNNAIEFGSAELPELERHYFLNSGYVFNLSPEFKFKPTIFVKVVENVRPNFDFTGTFIWNEVVSIGAAWRSFDSFDILAGFQINEQFKLGYAYDLTTTSLNQFNNGSHEIALNYKFSFSDDKIITPRHF